MDTEATVAIITALIGAIASIVVAQLSIKKALQQKELDEARVMQSLTDRIAQIEKQQEQYLVLVEKLNTIENTIIAVEKDIQYLKENK